MRDVPLRWKALLLVVALSLAGALSLTGFGANHTSEKGQVIWQNPNDIVSCGGNVIAQAVTMGVFQSETKPVCSKTWLILLPPSEGGNESQQLSFFASHRSDFVGVFMDDYFAQPAAVYLSLRAQNVDVCPVLYQVLTQPPETINAPCVILAVAPGGITNACQIKALMFDLKAQDVHILVYGIEYRGFGPSTAYVQAGFNASQGFEVVWH